MAPKNTQVLLSGIQAAFAKRKAKQSISRISEANAGVTIWRQTAAEVPIRASQDIVPVESEAFEQPATAVTEPFLDFADHAQSETSEEDADLPPAAPPPIRINRPTSARPIDIILEHASLLPTRGPQPSLVDLPTELSKTNKFTSPLPINPAAARLSRAHFKCSAKHACLTKSSNVSAPTLCTTCHRSGDAELAHCRFCYLRICKACASLLGRCGGDLKATLEELVRLGVWGALQGQG